MNEVSGRACAFIVASLEERGDLDSSLVAGLPVTIAELRDTRTRVSWEVLVEIVERVDRILGGPEALAKFGETHISSPVFDYLGRIARLFVSARDIHWMGARWFGHGLFWSVDAHFEDLADGRIRQTLEIQPGYSDSPPFFYILLGAIRAAPRHLGQPDSRVTMTLAPQRAVYEIEPPASLAALPRLRRRLASMRGSRGAIEELRAEQGELRRSYAKLDDVNRSLRAREEELRGILSSLDRTPVVLLDRDGTILSVFGAETLADDYGFPAGEPVGERLGKYLDPELAERALRLVRSTFDSGQSRQTEYCLRTPLAEFLFDVYLTPIRSTSGSVRAVLAVSRDVSDRRRLQADLEQADRLASLGVLATGVAHELNNPLGAILLSAEHALGLEDEAGVHAERQECLEDVVANTERCSHIVEGILRFARSEASEKASCSLNEIVQTTRNLTARYLEERDTSLALVLAEQLPRVIVNPLEIEQVILNLIRNSVEAAGDKASIIIKTEASGDNVCVTVCDNGPGLDSYERQHLFDPFYTTRATEGGIGLGLSVAHGIISEHGGEIRAQRASGGGTEVRIELPAEKHVGDGGVG